MNKEMNKEEIDKIKTVIDAIGSALEKDDVKEFNRIKELDETLINLVKKMENSLNNKEEYERAKELYKITEERRNILKNERNAKYQKFNNFVEESLKW